MFVSVQYYDDDDNGTVDLKEARNALKDLVTVSKRGFQGYPAWTDEAPCFQSFQTSRLTHRPIIVPITGPDRADH